MFPYYFPNINYLLYKKHKYNFKKFTHGIILLISGNDINFNKKNGHNYGKSAMNFNCYQYTAGVKEIFKKETTNSILLSYRKTAINKMIVTPYYSIRLIQLLEKYIFVF